MHIITYYQSSGVKAFAYFYGLTLNVAECYRSVCQVITRTIKKFESAFYWFSQQFLKKMLISSFFDVFIVFSCIVVFDRIKIKINFYLSCHVVVVGEFQL
jgi:hypothetical protein